MGRKKRPSQPLWSMHPDKDSEVQSLLEEEDLFFTFHDEDDDHTCIKSYDTNVMGSFQCLNNRCSTEGWSSKCIAITIRMYRHKEYNARVYHQRCKACNRVGNLVLEGSYEERIAYRLKKWSGRNVEEPQYSKESKGPHDTARCEGCQAGHCPQGTNRDRDSYR